MAGVNNVVYLFTGNTLRQLSCTRKKISRLSTWCFKEGVAAIERQEQSKRDQEKRGGDKKTLRQGSKKEWRGQKGKKRVEEGSRRVKGSRGV